MNNPTGQRQEQSKGNRLYYAVACAFGPRSCLWRRCFILDHKHVGTLSTLIEHLGNVIPAEQGGNHAP